ncbi:MAG: hypothetical protein JWO81_1401 [Alphaproteobacteria bacterium]|nr:hypothetical protein [Alphaproteobacteria bacterium]
MTDIRLFPILCRRAVSLGAFIPVLICGVAPTSAPAAAASHRSAAIIGKAANPSSPDRTSPVSRAITAINVRLQRCYAESEPTGPPEVAACNNKATDAFETLLRPSRQKEFEAFLQDLFPPLYHFLTKDGAGQSTMEGVVVATFRDVARKRTAILSGADRRPPQPRRGHPSLSQLFSRLHGEPLLYQHQYGQHLLRHWIRVRNGDCATHPVPHCASRLDAALAEELEADFNDK